MATKITGKSLNENANLSIALKREPGQSFYIGNATVEELMMEMQAAAMPPQPGDQGGDQGNAPAAGAPSAAQPD